MTVQRTAKLLADYQPSNFKISTLDLTFELSPAATRVTAVSMMQRQAAGPLRLDGNDLILESVKVNDLAWSHFRIEPEYLILDELPDAFKLEIITLINPEANTALEGLYLSDGAYCTQCEAEGFRRITYFLDRPDVMATYTTHIIADDSFHHLLSNGNLVAEEKLLDGRRKVTWVDPFPKPSYLFALVVGNFDELLGEYTTASGRRVKLAFYVDKGRKTEASFALEALKRSMRFDEEVFGLEYDLDIYMVVAVDFFNMGAMENKGLNVFNSKFVLAQPASATDTDYFHIESIIGHEYFHNWTGNRVTCRDWFQLSLKEGLTVFRDQQFSSAMGSATLNRIDAIKTIRTAQFAEDAGPMAHAIRPEKVLEMNNFYTVTVYDKGAEVIRMMHTLLGEQGFRKGMDLYFARHDGQAVTCDDFVQAMQDANQFDLSQFKRWYNQAGTPVVSAVVTHQANSLSLKLSQYTAPTADSSPKLPLHIPVGVELIDPVTPRHEKILLDLVEEQQNYQFDGWSEQTVVVLMTNFSAPVKLIHPMSTEQYLMIAAKAFDGVARWDAMQQLWVTLIGDAIAKNEQLQVPTSVIETFGQWLKSPGDDLAFTAELLTLPSFDTLAEHFDIIPVQALLESLHSCHQQIAKKLASDFMACYQSLPTDAYQYEQRQIGERALRNLCLKYLCFVADLPESMLQHQFQTSDNMTDIIAVPQALVKAGRPEVAFFLTDYLARFGDNPQLFDKHSNLLASMPNETVFARITELCQHEKFSWHNPNRVRAVFSAFAMLNPVMFHDTTGRGYQMVADAVMKADGINPQLAARMVTPLLAWRRYDAVRAALIKSELVRISQQTGLSNDLFEKVQRSLA